MKALAIRSPVDEGGGHPLDDLILLGAYRSSDAAHSKSAESESCTLSGLQDLGYTRCKQ